MTESAFMLRTVTVAISASTIDAGDVLDGRIVVNVPDRTVRPILPDLGPADWRTARWRDQPVSLEPGWVQLGQVPDAADADVIIVVCADRGG